MRLLGRSLLSGFAVVGILAVMTGACSNASEGDRCEGNNGNDDCDDGLICVSAGQQSGSNQGGNVGIVGICCPQDRSLATTPGCAPSPNPGDAAIPAEASGADVTVADSKADVESSTPATDSGNDASDASDDGDDGG